MPTFGMPALIVLVAGASTSLAVQDPIVITTDDLFLGLAPDPLVIEVVTRSSEQSPAGRCGDDSTESDQSGPLSRIESVLEWIESHVLGVQIVRASVECDPFCSGHFQGPDTILGCGIYGGCGTYCISDPTQFAYEEGCIDCTVRLPGNSCDGCSVDRPWAESTQTKEQHDENATRSRYGARDSERVLDFVDSPLVGRDRVEIAHDSILGPTEIRVETAGICRWRVSPIRADAKDQPHYALIRRDGSIAFRKSFWADGVVQSTVMDMAPLDSGGAAVAGGMIQADGAIARGIMVIASDGSVERFIRLDGYIPRHVAAAGDDSIWVVGAATSRYYGRPRPDHGVFRKYDLNGQFLGEFIPRSSFAPESHPSGKSGQGGRSFLRRVGEGVGFYSATAPEWIELDADGQALRRVPLPPVLVQFLAVTGSGRVLGWIAGRRFGIFELARDARDWAEVPGWVGTIDTPPSVGLPRGVDGERIAIQELPALPNLHFIGIPR